MKRYKKDKEIKFSKDITIRKNGMVTYNPTEDMLKEDGWEEYVPPIHKPSERGLLARAKQDKKREIEMWLDHSKALFIDGEEVKIDTETLNKMTFRVMAESAMNINKTSLWFDGKKHEMKTKDAMELLYRMQIYMGECFDISESHKQSVDSLESAEAVQAYDFEAGYPEKLNF